MAILKAPPKQPKTTVVQLRLDYGSTTMQEKNSRNMLSFSIALRPTW